MAGSINDFKASFQKDLARPNKFDVNIPVPLTLIPYVRNAKNLIYRCENANLPGRNFATVEQKIGSNPVEKYPYLTTYNDLDLTFIVDDDMNQKIFFDAWMNFINPTYNYNFRYKGDYSTAITINQYDVTNQISYSINLYDAYPISMNQMDLDWSSDGYHKLNVTFAYTYYQNNSLQAYGMQLIDAGLASFADAVGGLGGNAIGALGQSGNSLPNALQGGNVARDPDSRVQLTPNEIAAYNQAGF
jgi:hypothetical protein